MSKNVRRVKGRAAFVCGPCPFKQLHGLQLDDLIFPWPSGFAPYNEEERASLLAVFLFLVHIRVMETFE